MRYIKVSKHDRIRFELPVKPFVLVEINIFLRVQKQPTTKSRMSEYQIDSFAIKNFHFQLLKLVPEFKETFQLSLNEFTEFVEFNDKNFVKKIIQTCNLVCERPRCYVNSILNSMKVLLHLEKISISVLL